MKKILCLSLFLLAQGCGPSWVTGAETRTRYLPDPNGAASVSKPGKKPEGYEPVFDKTLERHYQLHRYFDCKGKIIKTETKIARQSDTGITLHPKNNIPIYRASFKNLRTGDTTTNRPFQDVKIVTIDMDATWYRLKVEEGANEIEYTYESCGVKDAEGNCQTYDLQEKATVIVNVTFIVKTLPETVDHAATTCN